MQMEDLGEKQCPIIEIITMCTDRIDEGCLSERFHGSAQQPPLIHTPSHRYLSGINLFVTNLRDVAINPGWNISISHPQYTGVYMNPWNMEVRSHS